MLTYVLCVIGGFIAGAGLMFFVYKNNQKAISAKEAAISTTVADIKKV